MALDDDPALDEAANGLPGRAVRGGVAEDRIELPNCFNMLSMPAPAFERAEPDREVFVSLAEREALVWS